MKSCAVTLLALFLFAVRTEVHAKQVMFHDGSYTWTHNPIRSQYKNNLVPLNWKSPVNYYEGSIYCRFEVLSKPSDLKMTAQFCFWQDGFKYESCGDQTPQFTGAGVMYYKSRRSPNEYSRIRGGGVKWDNMTKLVSQHMFKSPNKSGKLVATKACGKACWQSDVSAHVPIPYKVQMVVVAKGDKLVRPAGWIDCPTELCGDPLTVDAPDGWYLAGQRKGLQYHSASGRISIPKNLAPQSVTSASIFSLDGRRVQRMAVTDGIAHWNGCNANGAGTRSGPYIIRLHRDDGSENVSGVIVKN
jgi:hypothetical protein